MTLMPWAKLPVLGRGCQELEEDGGLAYPQCPHTQLLRPGGVGLLMPWQELGGRQEHHFWNPSKSVPGAGALLTTLYPS